MIGLLAGLVSIGFFVEGRFFGKLSDMFRLFGIVASIVCCNCEPTDADDAKT